MGRIYLSKFVAGAMTASDGERVNWRDARKEEFSRGGNAVYIGNVWEEANVWRGTRALWWLAGRTKETKIGGAEEARRNDRGGTLYSAACFRGSHVRLYRVSPSPPSRRIEDMIFES